MKKTYETICRGGRPNKKPEEKKNKSITFRLDENEYSTVQQKLDECRYNISEYLRRALMNSDITQAEYDAVKPDIIKLGNLMELVSVSATVVSAIPDETYNKINSLYRFAMDINVLIKRGNAQLKNASEEERINYRDELVRIKDEFMSIRKEILDNIKQ